ncbi:hypothetical protein ACOMHN_032863 [Nucella lapillus]
MSVLQSLKGTFQNVQQDIVEGFRALGALDSTTRQRKLQDLEAEGISVDTGADLLYRYHETWSQMMADSTQSAQTAHEIDRRVWGLFMLWERRAQSANQLLEEAAILPSIASTLKDMLEVVESLHEDFQAMEEEMERFEDVWEEEGVRGEQLYHCSQLAAYKKTQQTDSVAVKRKLWKKLSEQWKEADGRKEKGRKGRGHSVIAEMDHLSLLPSHDKLKDAHSAQDDVLSSDEGEHPESPSECAFIEDDYTLDYRSPGQHHHHDDDLFPEIDEDRPINFDDPGGCSGSADTGACVTDSCERDSGAPPWSGRQDSGQQ